MKAIAGTKREFASMEPGHEDREYVEGCTQPVSHDWPQWSPVMKTGNTALSWSSATSTSASLNGARS